MKKSFDVSFTLNLVINLAGLRLCVLNESLPILGILIPSRWKFPTPQPQNGTVDIDLKVVEKPSDQLELSAGGWP